MLQVTAFIVSLYSPSIPNNTIPSYPPFFPRCLCSTQLSFCSLSPLSLLSLSLLSMPLSLPSLSPLSPLSLPSLFPLSPVSSLVFFSPLPLPRSQVLKHIETTSPECLLYPGKVGLCEPAPVGSEGGVGTERKMVALLDQHQEGEQMYSREAFTLSR